MQVRRHTVVPGRKVPPDLVWKRCLLFALRGNGKGPEVVAQVPSSLSGGKVGRDGSRRGRVAWPWGRWLRGRF